MSDRSRPLWAQGDRDNDSRHGARGKPGKRPDKPNSNSRRRPEVLALEERTLLSRSPVGVDFGDFYEVESQRINLKVATDRLVLGLAQGTDLSVVVGLVAPGGLLAGGTIEETGSNRVVLVELPAERTFDDLTTLSTALDSVAGVEYVSEAFFEPATGEQVLATRDILVALQAGADPASVFARGDVSSFRSLRGTTDQFIVTTTQTGRDVLTLAADFEGATGVAWASPDFMSKVYKAALPNDPLISDQWHLNNTGQRGGKPGADAKVFGAWNLGVSGQGVLVAIVDDGVQYDHPDLAANLYTNPGEVAGNGIDDDGNGYVDDVHGWDFADGDNDVRPTQPGLGDPHGTSVTGVAVARGNNSLGVAGAAFQAKFLPVRIPFGTNVPLSVYAEAEYYASGRNTSGIGTWTKVDVINHSWGGSLPIVGMQAAITWSATQGRNGLGSLNFVATGNYSPIFPGQIMYPAAFSGTIAIGASGDNDLRAPYSQYSDKLDLVAPSNGGLQGITTTDRTGADGYDTTSDYTRDFGGTSSATPLASGIGALILQANPRLTLEEVRAILRGTADKIGGVVYDANGRHIEYGSGRINAERAVLQASLTFNYNTLADLEENQPYTNVAIATLAFGQLQVSPAEFSVQVNLGTGQPAVLAVLQPAGPNRYRVVVPQITYSEGGTYTITTSVIRQGVTALSQTASQKVTDRPLFADAVELSLNEGQSFNGTVATFRDTDPDINPPTSYTVNIDWGDGVVTPGTVSYAAGVYRVIGQHVYSGGDYPLKVTIQSPGGNEVEASLLARVQNSQLSVTQFPIQAVEGEPYPGLLATFLDADPRAQPSSYYKADIDWGDGPYVATDVNRPIPDFSGANRPLISTLRLSVGDFPIADLNVALNITHDRPSDLQVALVAPDGTRVNLFSNLLRTGPNLTATVLDDEASNPITSAAAPYTGVFRPAEPLSALDGKNLSGAWQLWVTDTVAGLAGTLNSWSLSVLAQGVITPRPASDGPGFQVTGRHVYQVGTYDKVQIRVRDGDQSDQTRTTTASVSNAEVLMTPMQVLATEGTEFSGIVAFFTDRNPNADPASFAAQLDWGDGQTALGRVTADGGGRFVITGKHTWQNPSITTSNPEGSFPVKVTLIERNATGTPPETTAAAKVSNALITGLASSFQATEGNEVTEAVGKFQDLGNAAGDAAQYAVTITWGDRSQTPGVVTGVKDQPGTFEVRGTHAYALAGEYDVKIAIADNGGDSLDLASKAKVLDAPLVTQGTIIVAEELVSTTLVQLGEFSDPNPFADPAQAFVGEVNWGDGQKSGAVIKGLTPNRYGVYGDHKFVNQGVFAIAASIFSPQGGVTVLSSGAYVNAMLVNVSGVLEAASDTGPSSNDNITNRAVTNFSGTASAPVPEKLANLTISLMARNTSTGELLTLGEAPVDAKGAWRIPGVSVAVGTYEVFALAKDSQRRATSAVSYVPAPNTPLVVDTQGPKILSSLYDGRAGAIRITYQDDRSGITPAVMLNKANYLFGPGGAQVPASKVDAVPGDPNSVLVRFGSSAAQRGRVVLTIPATSMTDAAGNPLVEKVFTSFPATSAPAASPYVAAFNTSGQGTTLPTPYVPAGQQLAVNRINSYLRSRYRVRR